MKKLLVIYRATAKLIASFLFISSISYAQSFDNVAPELGVDITSPFGDVFAADFDGDLDNDLVFTGRWEGADRYFRNDGEGFTEADINLPENSDGWKVIPMDFDHDGDLDVFINCYHTQNYLMMNENGNLVDRTAQFGITTGTYGRDVACIDIDHDGWMDILLGFRNTAWRLYRNTGGTGFEDITDASELPSRDDFHRFCEADADLDGETDLFMTTLYEGEDYFFVNRGDGVFDDWTDESGLSEAIGHGGCMWVDFDKDKYPDILTGGNNTHTIWHNNHDLTFTEMNVHGMGVMFDIYAWAATYAVGDIDQDGDFDIYAGQPDGGWWGLKPNQFFRNDSLVGNDIYFTDIAPELGMDFEPDTKPSFFDYDEDGDLDLFLRMYGVPSKLYRNNLNASNRLQVQVLGPEGEKDCWLTRVEVYEHGTENFVTSGETNYGGANRSGLNHYLVMNPNNSYDLRIYFANGESMLSADYPELSDIVPSAVDHLVTVYRGVGVLSGENERRAIPTSMSLSVYPNPFNPTTTLEFGLPSAGNVSIEVFDINGRLTANVISGYHTAGSHKYNFDASNLSTGVYFARISSGDFVATKKLMLLK